MRKVLHVPPMRSKLRLRVLGIPRNQPRKVDRPAFLMMTHGRREDHRHDIRMTPEQKVLTNW